MAADLVSLKAAAYDRLVQIDILQREVQNINQQISKLMQEQKAAADKAADKPAEKKADDNKK